MNYHHLHYFWMVVREGGVTRAATSLDVSQPTVSAQLAAFEKAVGQPLFTRSGRGLVLTATGQTIFNYADEIFRLGGELENAIRDGKTRGQRFVVGIVDVLPKIAVYRLLQPAFDTNTNTRLVCIEDKPERLLAELALHNIDLVLTDSQPPAGTSTVKAFYHLLGESGTAWFAAPSVVKRLREKFPACLNEAPLLLPDEGTALRRSINKWVADTKLRPVIRGEFSDTALLKAFGQAGGGIFPLPTVVEKEVAELYGVQAIGRTQDITTRFYAVSVQRQLKHPAVVKVCDTARQELFS
jgi:LysR family transcriptional activator of nhaA